MNSFTTDWLKKWAEYTPEKFALREHQRDISWNYYEFNRYAEYIAFQLNKDFGITKGDRVAVYSKNNAEYVFLFFACAKLSAILVPLNFRLTPAELDILIGDSKPGLFIYESDYGQQISKISRLADIEYKIDLNFVTALLQKEYPGNKSSDFAESGFDDPVMILYTAGTTGLPKGAIINHRMLFWNSVNTGLRLDINSKDHTQGYAPFFHTGGWNVLFTPFVHHGASHTLLTHFDAELILELMEKEKTTLLFGVPTMLQMMSQTEKFNSADLASVRYAIVGGAPMPIPLIELWHKKGIAIRQGYGLTEVGPNCFSLHQDDAIRKIGSIGQPNFYMQTKIMTDESIEAAAGETGELWLKSEVVTPGYWNKPEETEKAITDGWFHTGDMVRKDDYGYFYVVDRKKNMFISGGENVYPAEIEKFLYKNEKVIEVAVIGVEDQKWGETGCAFIVLKSGETMTPADVINSCTDNLAKYKIPRHIIFLETIPKNEAGKINRFELKKIYEQQFTNKSK